MMTTQGLLRPISRALAGIYSQLLILTPRQRRSLRKRVERMTETNVDWITYCAKNYLLELIDAASVRGIGVFSGEDAREEKEESPQ